MYPTMFRCIVAAAALLVAGCTSGESSESRAWQGSIDTLPNGAVHVSNPAEGVWDSASTWRIAEDLRIGSMDSEGPDMFGRIHDIAVDGLGRIYVLEGQAQEIRVFSSDGAYMRTIGREGAGPGEFRAATAIRMRGNGQFWVVDPRNTRYSLHDTSGAYLRSNRRESSFYMIPWVGYVDSAGNITERTRTAGIPGSGEGENVLITFDSSGTPVDTLVLPEYETETWDLRIDVGGGRFNFMSASVPFSPFQVLYPDPRGYLWFGVNDQYRLVQRNFDGDTIRVVEREAAPREVTGEEIDDRLERMDWFTDQGGTVERSDIPDVHVLFHQLFVDPEAHIWVRPDVPSEEAGRRFDIFDPEGRYLGRAVSDVSLAGGMPPIIRGDTLYTVTTDSLDIEYVVRARIQKGTDAER